MLDRLFLISSLIEPDSLDAICKRFERAIDRAIERDPKAFAGPDLLLAGPVADLERAGYPIKVVGNTAVIPLIGVMLRRAGPMACRFGIAGTDATRMAVEAAISDESIEQIVLRVDSPGGVVSGIDELATVIRESPKPITAVIEGQAMSAAYYAIAGAEKIVMGVGDMVGSIGVRMLLYDSSKAFSEAGIKPVVIDTGHYKSMGAVGTEVTIKQIAHLQGIADQAFTLFKGAVETGRNLSPSDVSALADGRFFTASEGINLGLVDDIGDLKSVLVTPPPKGASIEARRRRLQV